MSFSTAGYVRLHRKLLESPLFNDKPAAWLKIWIFILLRVNWKPAEFHSQDGGVVKIPAGSMVTSLEKLAHTRDLTIAHARKCLNYLRKSGTITLQSTHHWTLITVNNWASYQQVQEDSEHTNDGSEDIEILNEEMAERAHQRAHQRATIEEIKNNSNTLSKPDGSDRVWRKRQRKDPCGNIPPEILIWFNDEFWPLYPRREAKQNSIKAAALKVTTPELRAHYLDRLKIQAPVYLQRKAQGLGIPMASTWFNQDRASEELELTPEPTARRTNSRENEDYPEYVPLRKASSAITDQGLNLRGAA